MADAIVAHYDGPLITRAEAIASGLRRYFTGKPCKSGHIAERLLSKKCVVCNSGYNRKHYEANQEELTAKKRVYAAKRYAEHTGKCRDSNKRWAAKNRDKMAAYKARYYEQNKAALMTRNAAWRENNPERFGRFRIEWKRRNPEYVRADRQNRRAMVRKAEGRHSAEDIRALYKRQRGRCANPACRCALKNTYHADHILPLALGGTNWISNIQLLCPTCNLKKHAKHPIDWAQENGMLL